MGNCVALSRPGLVSCIGAAMAKHKRVLQVVKTDGKVLEFKAPILVKDILTNFCDPVGVATSREASLVHLPLNYELKIGKIYYILPSLDSVGSTLSPAGSTSSLADSKEAGVSVKRIKVVITKQQLQQLLTKQISWEVVLDKTKTSSHSVDSPTDWKPKLESIPEGSE